MYSQKNYLETQGIRGKYRISQVGSLLVAFSNLLESLFGKSNDHSPVSLNRSFADSGTYLVGPNGVQDQLKYDSITAIYPAVKSRVPDEGDVVNKNLIARFTWLGSEGQTINHYCLVVDGDNRQIIDSFDGVTKDWDVYGGPVDFMYYEVKNEG